MQLGKCDFLKSSYVDRSLSDRLVKIEERLKGEEKGGWYYLRGERRRKKSCFFKVLLYLSFSQKATNGDFDT